MKYTAPPLLLLLMACGHLLGCGESSEGDETDGDGGSTSSGGEASSGGATGDGDLPAGGDSSTGGGTTEGCESAIVASCSTTTVCSDYHGSGYTEEYVQTICEGADGELQIGAACNRAAWGSGCVQDISEMNRCKIAWRAESVDDHEALCAYDVIPAD